VEDGITMGVMADTVDLVVWVDLVEEE